MKPKQKPLPVAPDSSSEEEDEEDDDVESGVEQEEDVEDEDSASEGEDEDDNVFSALSTIPTPPIPAVLQKSLSREHILRIVKDHPQEIDLPHKTAIQKTNWSPFAGEGFSATHIKDEMDKLAKNVLRKLSLNELLTIALTNEKKFFCPPKRERKIIKSNVYQLFLKDFHAQYSEMSIAERLKLAGAKYKQLSEEELERYTKMVISSNIEKGFLNKDGSEKEKEKATRKTKRDTLPGQTDLRTLFSPIQKPAAAPRVATANGTPKKDVKEKAVAEKKSPKKSTKQVPEEVKVDEVTGAKPKKGAAAAQKAIKKEGADAGMETVAVNVFDYFAESRKSKGDTKDEIQKAFNALTTVERADTTYKIIQLVESKYNKRCILSKADQEVLDKHEGRPAHPGTAYTIFMNEKIADPSLAHLPYREKSTKIGSLWKEMEANERDKYDKTFEAKKAAYEANYADFLKNLPEFRRAQETAPKAKKQRKRRASVGESPAEGSDERTNSTFISPEAAAGATTTKKKSEAGGEAAKRRQRSKTIDCSSSMNIMDFFQSNKVQETVTPVKKVAQKRKAVEVKQEVKEEVGVQNGETPKSPEKAKKKRKKTEEIPPMVVIPLPEVPQPLTNGASSPKKGKKDPKVKPTAKSPPPQAPTPEPEPEAKPPKKSKKKVTKEPPAEVQQEVKQPEENKKKKKAKGNKLPEPVKPPETAKAYFKSVYKGDPEAASKAYKKLSLDEKKKYHEQLTVVSAKYLDDLKAYITTLSKEEVALFMARQE